ncbi:hypothetical protein LEP1GSC058_2164 [Leptospira fainei serovar Hurstbridge str. BUT 6]|uniref:Uncharacterized protein n=1 Tax=Leptospira fainei serovar Hurstbridge str. BUT 6 TaxID=1193011 RepID=S3UXY4_9LEPT|nr:hypothetical protein LEP1GSC058_2164 [Leptospira fainei serovar Hurstbridge str. BUT 6]
MLFFDDFWKSEFLLFSRKFRFLGHILSFDPFADFPKLFFDLFLKFSDSYVPRRYTAPEKDNFAKFLRYSPPISENN